MAEFTPELFDRICERIAEGESLRAICAEDGMPRKASVMRWLASDTALSDQYARAREMQADSLFDECLTIADDTARDPSDRRMSFDARKWMAGKLRPKVYGDKVAIGGADDLPAIKTQDVTAADVVAARLAAIKSRASGEPDA